MTKNEKRILSKTIKSIINYNPNAWSELKSQIFHQGYQDYYPVQGDFDIPAKIAIKKLPIETKEELFKEWKKAEPLRPIENEQQIFDFYAHSIVEEVIKRARIAANRTIHW